MSRRFKVYKSRHGYELLDILPTNHTLFLEYTNITAGNSIQYVRHGFEWKIPTIRTETVSVWNFRQLGITSSVADAIYASSHDLTPNPQYTHLVYVISITPLNKYNILPGVKTDFETLLMWKIPLGDSPALNRNSSKAEVDAWTETNIDSAIKILEYRTIYAMNNLDLVVKNMTPHFKDSPKDIVVEFINKIREDFSLFNICGVDEIGDTFLGSADSSAFVSVPDNTMIMIGFYDVHKQDWILYEEGEIKMSNPQRNFLYSDPEFYVSFFIADATSPWRTHYSVLDILVRSVPSPTGEILAPQPIKYESRNAFSYGDITNLTDNNIWKDDYIMTEPGKLLAYTDKALQKTKYGFYYGDDTHVPMRIITVHIANPPGGGAAMRFPCLGPPEIASERRLFVDHNTEDPAKYYLPQPTTANVDETPSITAILELGSDTLKILADNPNADYTTTVGAINHQLRGLDVEADRPSSDYNALWASPVLKMPDGVDFGRWSKNRVKVSYMYLCEQFDLMGDDNFNNAFTIDKGRYIVDNESLEGAAALIRIYKRLQNDYVKLATFVNQKWIYVQKRNFVVHAGETGVVIGEYLKNNVENYRQIFNNAPVHYVKIFPDFDELAKLWRNNPNITVRWQNNILVPNPTTPGHISIRKEYCKSMRSVIIPPKERDLLGVTPTKTKGINLYRYK